MYETNLGRDGPEGLLGTYARPWVFSLDADSPALRRALDAGGRGITVLDGDMVVLRPGGDPDHLLPVLDVPVTLAGLSRHNVANALGCLMRKCCRGPIA